MSDGRTTLELFSTCPPFSSAQKDKYFESVVEVARRSEAGGCRGILVYTDNSLLDPWLVSQLIVQNTEALCPLVAVQPVYMHPYTVAKMVTSFAAIHGRRLYLNMVAGGFKNDLLALNDTTPHDDRYQRLLEYVLIIKALLSRDAPVSYDGRFYKVHNLRLAPALPASLFPEIFVSGSSDAGMSVAGAVDATAIKYPKPAGEEEGSAAPTVRVGVRLGIIARAETDEAWSIALSRFPENRKGQLTHQLAMKTSDSVWHKQLSGLADVPGGSPYWLWPFENYKTFCPYLVGDYDAVAAELARYVGLGHNTFILDVPGGPDEFAHIRFAFDRALHSMKCQSFYTIG